MMIYLVIPARARDDEHPMYTVRGASLDKAKAEQMIRHLIAEGFASEGENIIHEMEMDTVRQGFATYHPI